MLKASGEASFYESAAENHVLLLATRAHDRIERNGEPHQLLRTLTRVHAIIRDNIT
jgi:hypothetical protein